jgi:hypothetical protein
MHDKYVRCMKGLNTVSYLVLAENHFHSWWNSLFVFVSIAFTLAIFHFLRDNESLKMKKERLGATQIAMIGKEDELEQIEHEMKCGNKMM